MHRRRAGDGGDLREHRLSAVAARDLDVVVLGATGVTGREVARYLGERARAGSLRWAAAGRDRGRLAGALAQLGGDVPELLEADVGQPATLAALAARARVVLDLVGPYTRYGQPVIEACLSEGAHYVDLTGELPFVRAVIERFHEPARAAGVKIVQVCGFEALPPDLLVSMLSQAARAGADALAEVDVQVGFTPPPGRPRASEAFSGGTFQSLAAVAGSEQAGQITDPAMLISDPALAERVRQVSPIALAPRRGSDGAVIAPMAPAAFINPAVIHRSEELAALAEGRDAEPFRYREGLALAGGAPTLPARWALAGALSATQVTLGVLVRARPAVRRPLAELMARHGPQSGFGPSGERLEQWRWEMRASGRTRGGRALSARLDAEGHPGYLATARLLGEAGILLAQESATPAGGGCLTPAGALGTACLQRFAQARLRFALGEA